MKNRWYIKEDPLHSEAQWTGHSIDGVGRSVRQCCVYHGSQPQNGDNDVDNNPDNMRHRAATGPTAATGGWRQPSRRLGPHGMAMLHYASIVLMMEFLFDFLANKATSNALLVCNSGHIDMMQ